MKIHYGWIGNFISKIQEENSRFWRKCSDGQRSLLFDPETKGKIKNQRITIIPSYLNDKLAKVKESYKIDNNVFDEPVSLTLISYFLPRFDRTSADFRLHKIINILLSNKCKINYIYCSKTPNDSKYLKALNGDINFSYFRLNQKVYEEAVTEIAADYVFITDLWRINYVKFLTKLTAKLRQQNSSLKIIIDTIDFHYKEFIRKYELSKDGDDRSLAYKFLKNEKILYKIADTVIVISEKEKEDIEKSILGIKDIKIIPNIHFINESPLPLAGRRNVCFVGNFGNKHNVDAVLYFIDNVFPLILEINPNIEFHIIGNRSEKYRKIFKAKNVRVIGFVKNLEKVLNYYRLFVCPMTYGAGMKGKIGMAAALGLPIVTTSIGAEGFPVKNGEEFFISDSPLDFADKCNYCLTDQAVWQNLSIKSQLMIAENFSPVFVARKLASIFARDKIECRI